MSRYPSPSRLRTFVVAAFAVLLLVQGPPAWGVHPTQKGVKTQVEGLEEQWRLATLAGDVPAMDRLLSEDFVGISWNGQVSTKAMQLERARDRTMVISRMDFSDTKVKIVGSVAIVTALAQVEGSSEGADMRGIYRYTRVYQRLPSGTWKITNFEVTRVPDTGDHPHRSHDPHP